MTHNNNIMKKKGQLGGGLPDLTWFIVFVGIMFALLCVILLS